MVGLDADHLYALSKSAVLKRKTKRIKHFFKLDTQLDTYTKHAVSNFFFI